MVRSLVQWILAQKNRRKLWAGLLTGIASIAGLLAKGMVEGVGHVVVVSGSEHHASETTQSPLMPTVVEGNSGAVVVGDLNSLGSTYAIEQIPFDERQTDSTSYDAKTEIRDNRGPVIVGNGNQFHAESLVDTQITQLRQRHRLLNSSVASLPNQRTKRVLAEGLKRIDQDIASLTMESDVAECSNGMDLVEAKIAYLNRNFSRAVHLLKQIDCDDARIQLFDVYCSNQDFANAIAAANSLKDRSIRSRATKVRAWIIASDLTGNPNTLLELSKLIIEAEDINRLMRPRMDVDERFEQLDLTNDETVLLTNWLDAAAETDDITYEMIPFGIASTKADGVLAVADFVTDIGGRRLEIISEISNAGETLSRAVVLDGLANQSQATHAAYSAITKSCPDSTEKREEFREAAVELDSQLASIVESEIRLRGHDAAVENALLRFQFAARSFERCDVEKAIRQIEPLIKELTIPQINSRLTPDQRDLRMIGWAAFNLASVLDFENQFDIAVRYEQIGSWANVIYSHRTKLRTFPFHNDACRGLLLQATFCTDNEICSQCAQKVEDLIRLSDNPDVMRNDLKQFLGRLKEMSVDVPTTLVSRLECD